jgi:hypothetical protein
MTKADEMREILEGVVHYRRGMDEIQSKSSTFTTHCGLAAPWELLHRGSRVPQPPHACEVCAERWFQDVVVPAQASLRTRKSR